MADVNPRQSAHKRRKYFMSQFFRLIAYHLRVICGCDELLSTPFCTHVDTSGAFPSGVAILATVLVTFLTEI